MIPILIISGIVAISLTGIIAGSLGGAFRESTRLKRVKLEEETKQLQYQKEMLELEVKREEAQIKRLEAESKSYDRLISGEQT